MGGLIRTLSRGLSVISVKIVGIRILSLDAQLGPSLLLPKKTDSLRALNVRPGEV